MCNFGLELRIPEIRSHMLYQRSHPAIPTVLDSLITEIKQPGKAVSFSPPTHAPVTFSRDSHITSFSCHFL